MVNHGKGRLVLVHALAPLVFCVAGCNVAATTDATGGVGDAGATPNGCDRGTTVLLTDYMSTQIALSTPDGTTQSAAFLTTASTHASGLAFALSGDVALPRATPASGRVVLIDRDGTNVITWADPATAAVQAQLPVGTGFESNPYDYLEIDATYAYVARWGANAAPGKQAFDTGSDVLVVDTKKPAIVKSIAMPTVAGLPPRPSGMVRVGDTVIVVLEPTSVDFATTADGVLVGLANQAIAWQSTITGLRNCDRAALSPSGRQMAIACEGALAMDGTVADPSTSAIALYDVTSLPPTLVRTFPVRDQLGATVQNGLAWVNETTLLGKTQTPLGGATNNQAFTLDLGTGKATVLLTAGTDAKGGGKGLVYGDVLCRPGCGDVCLMADADVGKLRRWSIGAGGLTPLADVVVDATTGLPPVSLGGW